MSDARRPTTQIHRFRDGCPVALLPWWHQPDRDLHDHVFTELVIVIAGSGIHRTEDGDHPLVVGDVFVVAEGDRHGYRDTEDLEIVNVLFQTAAVPLPLSGMTRLAGWQQLFALEPRLRGARRGRSRLRLGVEDLRIVAAQVSALEASLSAREQGYQARAVIELLELIWQLCRAPSIRRDAEARQARALATALARIERECERPIELAEIEGRRVVSRTERFRGGADPAVQARFLGFTRGNSLLRAFKQVTGTTPVDHVIRRRLARAAERLRTTRQSITTIALNVGFGDSNYFARQFRRVYGHSPSAYRAG